MLYNVANCRLQGFHGSGIFRFCQRRHFSGGQNLPAQNCKALVDRRKGFNRLAFIAFNTAQYLAKCFLIIRSGFERIGSPGRGRILFAPGDAGQLFGYVFKPD